MGEIKEAKIINERVDGLLKEMEEKFKKAVEGQKPLQDELNKEVTRLMEEYDKRDEIKEFEGIKAKADYITLTISMPLTDETKEKVIEEIVRGSERDGILDEEV